MLIVHTMNIKNGRFIFKSKIFLGGFNITAKKKLRYSQLKFN